MSYTKTTNFAIKDTYLTGNPGKVIKGVEIDAEFDNIVTADGLNLKRDGSAAATADIPMGGFKLTDIAAGVARTDAARVGQLQDNTVVTANSISGVDTITGTLSPVITAYAAGQTFRFVSVGANTGAATLNLNGVGAKSITKNGATALVAGDIPSGAVVQVTYDGVRFQLTSNIAAPAPTTDYLNTTRIDVASASTVDLTSSAPNTRHINITGTTGITAFTVAAGRCYFVRFNAALTLTNNANIVTQSGANITTTAGDTCVMRATAANTVEVLAYTPFLNQSVGYGQTWQSFVVGATRLNGTTYTNTTGKPIMISLLGSIGSFQVIIGGVPLSIAVAGGSYIFTWSAIVPNNTTYLVTGSQNWAELR